MAPGRHPCPVRLGADSGRDQPMTCVTHAELAAAVVAPAPQDRSVRRPHVCLLPALTRTQSASVPTRVGTLRSISSPSPSSPKLLSPQHHRACSVRTPHVWSAPAVSRTQSASVPTRVGTNRGSGHPTRAGRRSFCPSTTGTDPYESRTYEDLPSPSPSRPRCRPGSAPNGRSDHRARAAPYRLRPQHHNDRSMRTPHVCELPAITRAQSALPPTRVGTSRSVLSPTPSWP